MIEYWIKYHDKMITALTEHMIMVVTCLVISITLAGVFTVLSIYSIWIRNGLLYFFSVVYSIPSLALFALLIPLTGLGMTSAVTALTFYNQYLLLQNFISGIWGVDESIIEAATGMGMTRFQMLRKVQLPLAHRALLAGLRIAAVSTISIATIAASINAGGLGSILFDGLRTMNVVKILWGSILSIGLALIVNAVLSFAERTIT